MERWLVQSNIFRLQIVLKAELTEAERRAMERLMAQQQSKLNELERSVARR